MCLHTHTQSELATHNLIDPREFSSGQFGPGGGSRWGHQGSGCQRGCRSVWCWHYTHTRTDTDAFNGQRRLGNHFSTLKSCSFILPTSNRKHFLVGRMKQSASVLNEEAGGSAQSCSKLTKEEEATMHGQRYPLHQLEASCWLNKSHLTETSEKICFLNLDVRSKNVFSGLFSRRIDEVNLKKGFRQQSVLAG